MFTNSYKQQYSGHYPLQSRNHPSPIYFTQKINRKLFTPMKSNPTYHTNHPTHQPTLSLYSYHSKAIRNQSQNKNILNLTAKTRKDISVSKSKVKSKGMPSSKNKSKINKKSKIKDKSKNTHNIKNSKDIAKLIADQQKQTLTTNKQSVRKARQNINSQQLTKFYTKISEIFDLTIMNDTLPQQIQLFLVQPLKALRLTLSRKGKSQIGRTLSEFKSSCMQVYRQVPSSQIILFLRTQLKENTRWISLNHSSRMKKQSERQSRQRYFQSLSVKSNSTKSNDHQTLNRIQQRLNAYLGHTFSKASKVYI